VFKGGKEVCRPSESPGAVAQPSRATVACEKIHCKMHNGGKNTAAFKDIIDWFADGGKIHFRQTSRSLSFSPRLQRAACRQRRKTRGQGVDGSRRCCGHRSTLQQTEKTCNWGSARVTLDLQKVKAQTK